MEKATIYDYVRMCNGLNEKCYECKLYDECRVGYNCTWVLRNCTDRANDIILKWCKEHPVKTRQDKFLEMFPNAKLNGGIIDICPKTVDRGYNRGYCNGEECYNCRSKYWLAEVEENE